MGRPRLLDLFCGPGGASVGYERAGFEVVGVDVRSQGRYPFAFRLEDALSASLAGFDAVHASPPCQRYSRTRWMHPQLGDEHYPDLVGRVRDRLVAWGGPFVIENVPGSPLAAQLLLCGSMFGLPVQRHRYFEGNWPMPLPPFGCNDVGPWLNCYTSGPSRRGTEREYADGMGVTWAQVDGRRTGTSALEAIPPAYTEHIGRGLAAVV